MRGRRLGGLLCSVALLTGAGLAVITGGGAAGAVSTLTPTTTADDNTEGSLRWILEITAQEGDTVELAPGALYQLDRCVVPPEAGAEGEVDAATFAGSGDIEIGAAVVIVGNGATIQQTCGGERVLYTEDDLTLVNVTITGGTSTGGGGGGVRVDEVSGLTFTVIDSSIVGNCTTGSGGGFKMNTSGDVVIENSTFTENVADDSGGAFSHSHAGNVTMVNSTVSGNSANYAGGVDVRDGDFRVVYSDVVDNQIIDGTTCGVTDSSVGEEQDAAPSAVVNPANVSATTIRAFGTVIALPVNGVNCSEEGTTSSGYNFADDLTCDLDHTTDTQGTGAGFDPMLGALASNGGPTLTHLPETGSPLIDAIPTAACSGGNALADDTITTDQRSLVRPDVLNQQCDIGSVEVQTELPPVIQPTFTG